MKVGVTSLAGVLLLAGCRVSLGPALPAPSEAPRASTTAVVAPAGPDLTALGPGASPGNAEGPGGFVPRGSARNFYTGAGGRLWYYMNNYYWVAPTAPREDLWIKAEVREQFHDLRTWPDGASTPGPEPKVTMEYWQVGPTGRSVRLDNHKDYCLLSDRYTAGSIRVEVTLTLGHLELRDKGGRWSRPRRGYILVSRNYSGGGGIGADRARFEPLPTEAVTVWGYRVPWDTHPQRLTRSNWRRLALPTWRLVERRAPPRPSVAAPVVTPASASPAKR